MLLYSSPKEAQRLVYLFDELDVGQPHTPIPIYVDSSGVVSLVFNPVDHQSNKHVRIACHYAREMTELKVIVPQRIATTENLADGFTKALGAPQFKKCVDSYVAELAGISALSVAPATEIVLPVFVQTCEWSQTTETLTSDCAPTLFE
jgi:hypothetical protein